MSRSPIAFVLLLLALVAFASSGSKQAAKEKVKEVAKDKISKALIEKLPQMSPPPYQVQIPQVPNQQPTCPGPNCPYNNPQQYRADLSSLNYVTSADEPLIMLASLRRGRASSLGNVQNLIDRGGCSSCQNGQGCNGPNCNGPNCNGPNCNGPNCNRGQESKKLVEKSLPELTSEAPAQEEQPLVDYKIDNKAIEAAPALTEDAPALPAPAAKSQPVVAKPLVAKPAAPAMPIRRLQDRRLSRGSNGWRLRLLRPADSRFADAIEEEFKADAKLREFAANYGYDVIDNDRDDRNFRTWSRLGYPADKTTLVLVDDRDRIAYRATGESIPETTKAIYATLRDRAAQQVEARETDYRLQQPSFDSSSYFREGPNYCPNCQRHSF
jgi:hypothetical protein